MCSTLGLEAASSQHAVFKHVGQSLKCAAVLIFACAKDCSATIWRNYFVCHFVLDIYLPVVRGPNVHLINATLDNSLGQLFNYVIKPLIM